MKYKNWILFIILITVLAGCQKRELLNEIETVQHFIALHNEGNIHEKIKMLSKNARIIVNKDTLSQGRKEWMKLSEWDAEMQSQINISNLFVNEDGIVNGDFSESTIWYQKLGLESVIFSKAAFTINNHFIEEINLEITENSRNELKNKAEIVKENKTQFNSLFQLFSGRLELNKKNAKEIIKELEKIPGHLFRDLKGICENPDFEYNRKYVYYPNKWNPDGIYGAFFTADGTKIGLGGATGLIELWDANTFETICKMEDHSKSVSTTLFSPDSKILISGSSDSTARLWNTENCELIKTFRDHKDMVFTTLYSKKGNYFATTSDDSSVIVYQAKTYEIVHQLPHQGGQYFVWISDDEKYIATGGHDYQVTLWDMKTGEKIREFKGHKGPVYCMVISSDNKYIVSGAGDFSVKLWELETGKCIQTFCGHKDEVYVAMFSPDEQEIISSSGDHTIRRWNIDTGKETMIYKGHKGTICTIHNHPDGKKLLSAGQDGTAKIWDIETGEILLSKRMYAD